MSRDTNQEAAADDEGALDENAALYEQVYALARQVPCGRVISYGALGARCEPPISGYICGRIMGIARDDSVPWWRVVAKSGVLPIIKRNPQLADEQRERLENEGVGFTNGRIQMNEFSIDDD
jgi:methylated-DNA-protein-cysteine methyltransferase-like protein